jgi:tRNA(Ile2) C34 agmatinyltransferase TiaS
MSKQVITRNALRCGKCGDEIESKHRHDFKWCKCGAIAVDGGLEYLRRVGDWPSATELSTYEPEVD